MWEIETLSVNSAALRFGREAPPEFKQAAWKVY